jgi:hypothetical protein
MAGDVHLHGIPGWVWASFVAALFFFGVLYTVPEAKDELRKLFSSQRLSSTRKPSHPELEPIIPRRAHPSSSLSENKDLLYPTKKEAEADCPGRASKSDLCNEEEGRCLWECR